MKPSNIVSLRETLAADHRLQVLVAAIVAALLALTAMVSVTMTAIATGELGSGAAGMASDIVPKGAGSQVRPGDCGLFWRVVPDPNSSATYNHLTNVAAISPGDAWAVGSYRVSVGGSDVDRATAQHWNGTDWALVTVPQPGDASYLYGISAPSSDDIWAVGGSYSANTSIVSTLIIHWDGSSWTQVTSPSPDPHSNVLYSASAVASDAVWAVGARDTGTLVLFWDGTTWSSIPTPTVGQFDSLYSVSALSAGDMWAVGRYVDSGSPPLQRTLTMHCSRSGCTVPTSPNGGVGNNQLYGVAALSSSDVWAVGTSIVMTQPLQSVPLAIRWDGSGWTVPPVPPLPANTDLASFEAVVAVSSNDVWGLGSAHNGTTGDVDTYTAHWNGSVWTLVISPNLGSTNALDGGAALSSNDIWAVGIYQMGSTYLNLIEHYSDPCVTPSPTTIPIGTPSPTPPTSCSIQFTDVPAGSTFYSYVHCLACQNILGGYSTGCPTGNPCFKPGNPVTRGQLAKIVSNSAGYNDQHNNQTFQDVPVGSPFYDFVERLSSRSIIGGYACGGAGEPCVPPANLPYFRPNAQVTRGQTSKIVAIAASLPAPPQGQQTFQDVPTNSTFWQWIESLATAGTIGGYPCGGAGEPCVPPQNRPYFRPNNNVTRGQAAKIVSNTFFPSCQSHEQK
jgi:hypothetical protein